VEGEHPITQHEKTFGPNLPISPNGDSTEEAITKDGDNSGPGRNPGFRGNRAEKNTGGERKHAGNNQHRGRRFTRQTGEILPKKRPKGQADYIKNYHLAANKNWKAKERSKGRGTIGTKDTRREGETDGDQRGGKR